MLLKWGLGIGLICLTTFGCFGQNPSLQNTEETTKSTKPSKVRVKNPKKALYYSLILPGAGDIYNKRYWKLPLVYGGIAGVAYGIQWNTRLYNRFQTALSLKRQGLEHEFSNTSLDNVTALENRRNFYDKNRQLSYIGMVGVYGLQAIWAFVDAHLKDFDMDEDISFIRLKPNLDVYGPTGEPIYGIGISISLNGR